MDKARNYFDRQNEDIYEAKKFPDLTGDGKVTKADILKGRGVDLDEDIDEAKKFPDLTGDGKVTKADILKGRGVDLDEEMSIEEIQEAIAYLKKKL
jgi:Ca2+-binding EF-hand superfamily protein